MKEFYYLCVSIYESAPVFPTLSRTTSRYAPLLSSILYHKDSAKRRGHCGSAGFCVTWGFVRPLPPVGGQWPGQNVSVLHSPRHTGLGIHQQVPLGPFSISDHSCEPSPSASLWCTWKALNKVNLTARRKYITFLVWIEDAVIAQALLYSAFSHLHL